MGAIDAVSITDFGPSVIAQNLTAAEDGASVDVTRTRGEAFLVDIATVNTSGDITVSFQEKDPGGSFSDIADGDLDFGNSAESTNGFQKTGVGSPVREVVGYKGDNSELRVKVNSVGSSGDFETVMGVLKYMPRHLYDL